MKSIETGAAAVAEKHLEEREAARAAAGADAGLRDGLKTADQDPEQEWTQAARKMLEELREGIKQLKEIKADRDAPKDIDLSEGPWELKGPFGFFRGSDPYKAAAAVVTAWCEKNYFDSFLVTLELDGVLGTYILQYDFENGNPNTPVWNTDWYEGQQKIWVMGFRAVSDFRMRGAPPGET